MNQKFPKTKKLKSKTLISNLLEKGKRFSCGKLRIIVLQNHELKFTKIGVSVPKKNFKKSTDRNRIKRLLREFYRLNKEIFKERFGENFSAMIFFISKEKPKKLQDLESDFLGIFNKI